MGRFLFVVPPLRGHINPTIAVGRALERRGHACGWLADDVLIGPMLPADVHRVNAGATTRTEWTTEVRNARLGLRGPAALQFLWERMLVPLAVGMAPGVEGAVERWRPDVLVVDQQALAGAVVAEGRGLRWATSATTSAELVDPFALLPKVGDWVRAQVDEIRHRLGFDIATGPRHDLRFSPHLVIAFTTEALAGPLSRVAAVAGLPAERIALVGPALDHDAAPSGGTDAAPSGGTDAAAWVRAQREEVGTAVLVSLGTLSAHEGGRFFASVLEAIRPMDVAAVVVADPAAIGELDAPLRARVLVHADVPQLRVLEHVDAVVCHGGHNTTCEALALGLPLVLAPIRDDQPVVAQQVVDAGAGIRVRFGRAGAGELRRALEAVLDDPSYRAGAARIRASFERAGGAEEAARRLEGLLASPHPGSPGA